VVPSTIPAVGRAADRQTLAGWYRQNRERSRRLFDLIDPAAYYTRPIALRNPIVFYEGHLPAFSVIALLERGFGRPRVDPEMERLFERGIDPHSVDAAVPRSGAGTVWPSRAEVLAYGERADKAILDVLESVDDDVNGMRSRDPRQVEGIFTALEHEAMHQETLLYMWHRLPYDQKQATAPIKYELGVAPTQSNVRVPAGNATLGADRSRVAFGWDNEFGESVLPMEAFEIDAHSVTNADFLAFVDAGGYRTPAFWSDAGWRWRETEGVSHPSFWAHEDGAWLWRGLFEFVPLPLSWPVYVSYEEASAFARWRGRRLPTEAEYHRAAFGTPEGSERACPWGADPPDATRCNADFVSWDPVPCGARPSGASAWGVHDLVGNGWEWTSTIFEPFPGFAPMRSYPEYSADFFDGQHYVMKGASPATAAALIRRSFRNWFRPNYPYVYAKFRTVAC
jgi:iron(II)-dependent oxidoreductase